MVKFEWQVDTSLDVVDANDGLLSLREAMTQASAGDVISFADDLQIILEESLLLDKNITIDGKGHQVSISAESVPIFEMNTANVTLKNLSLCSYYDGEDAGIITVAPAQSLLLYNVSDIDSTSVLNWAISEDKTGNEWDGDIRLYDSSDIHNIVVGAGGNKLLATEDTTSIIRNATIFGTSERSSGDIELNAIGYDLKADNNGDIYLRSTAKAYNTVVRENGAVLASGGALMDGLSIEYKGAVQVSPGVKLTGDISVAGAVFGTSTDSLLEGDANLTFDISQRDSSKSFTFSFYGGEREAVSLIEDLRVFQGARNYYITVSSSQSFGKYSLAGNAQSFTGNIILKCNGVDLGNFSISNGEVKQSQITAGTRKYELSLDNGTLALSVTNATPVITICEKDNFDQEAYFGEYRYVAEGENAGYYVKTDESQRFKASLSISMDIVSSAYLAYCDYYMYATELETKNSDGTYRRRDDYVFATGNDINTIALVGTKWTSYSSGTANWARVTVENGEDNNENLTDDIIPPELITDYSGFSKTITITNSIGFDCTEYLGVYSLMTSGENAGYYVSTDGKQRFAVQLSLSSEICSYSYEQFWSEYAYASEMETKYGNRFYGRDDFVFSTTTRLQRIDENGEYALGTKFTIQGDDHSRWAGVSFSSDAEQPPIEDIPNNDTSLPKYIYINNALGFDCTCYIGKYTLNTIGTNAGYYVHENGSQRFKATLSVSSDICSEAFSAFFEQYAFASELESSHGGSFYGRDDYLFCTDDSVIDAEYVGTKFTIKPDGTFTWASVSIDTNELIGVNESVDTTVSPTDELDYNSLPSSIVVNDVDGFDCKCYLGIYTLFTQGENAGYYVHSSGTQRFKATASLSSEICSSAFSSFFGTYEYAFELESGYNDVFYGRDDYIFSSIPNLEDAFSAGNLKLGTKNTIQKDTAPNWADVTTLDDSSLENEWEDLPLTLTVCPHEGFDCTEYYGTYILTLDGSNAGYYVKVDGTQRFSANLSISSSICSSAFSKQCEEYLFASEMETAFDGGEFFKRDDYIFCRENTFATAEYLGTKFTIGDNGNCEWAEISSNESEIEEPDDSGLTSNTMTGLLISPIFADSDIAYVRYSFDNDRTWQEYQIGAGIAMETNRSISFRIFNRGGFYKESSFSFLQNNDASSLQWVSAESYEYTLEVSNDGFQHAFSMKVPYNYVDTLALPNDYEWRLLDKNGIGIKLKVCTDEENEVKTVKADNANAVSLLWSKPSDIWAKGYTASHVGSFNGQESDKWLDESVSITGRNRIMDIFEGATSNREMNMDKRTILILTDDENGDALFVDDIYSTLPTGVDVQARIARIDEIHAGLGNDVIDLTSERFEYIGMGLTVKGGMGNDVIWANKGDNWLFGDAGDDRIVGASGNDIIVGGAGNDSLHGGGGEDIFAFGGDWGQDTVEQLAMGKITLWFANGKESNWNASTLTYSDGKNSVTVSGVDLQNISLKFGDEGERFSELFAAGAFNEFTSNRIFEDMDKGMLA